MNIYGQTKHINEIILSDICSSNKNFTSIIFRYFNVAGAHITGLISDNPKKKSSKYFRQYKNIMRILTKYSKFLVEIIKQKMEPVFVIIYILWI